MRNSSQTPNLATMRKLRSFVENYTEIMKTKPVAQTMIFTSVPVEEVPEDIRRMGQELCKEVNDNMTLKEKLNTKYQEMINKLDEKIVEHQMIIAELVKEKQAYERVIEDINED